MDFPNSESVGFQFFGPGTGDTKMRAPKNRSSLGTFSEPFAAGLQNWVNFIVMMLTLHLGFSIFQPSTGLLERHGGVEEPSRPSLRLVMIG